VRKEEREGGREGEREREGEIPSEKESESVYLVCVLCVLCVFCVLREYGILHVKVDISQVHSHTTHSNFKIRHTKGPQSQHTPNLKANME